MVPQDIGRVLLNLFNNAFYAVNEKAMLSTNDYKPAVVVSTKRTNDKVCIKIADNGIGIPQNVKEKIFQHFLQQNQAERALGLA